MKLRLLQAMELLRRVDIRDAHVYGGLLLVALGLVFIYWPLAPIVCGAVLMALALRRS